MITLHYDKNTRNNYTLDTSVQATRMQFTSLIGSINWYNVTDYGSFTFRTSADNFVTYYTVTLDEGNWSLSDMISGLNAKLSTITAPGTYELSYDQLTNEIIFKDTSNTYLVQVITGFDNTQGVSTDLSVMLGYDESSSQCLACVEIRSVNSPMISYPYVVLELSFNVCYSHQVCKNNEIVSTGKMLINIPVENGFTGNLVYQNTLASAYLVMFNQVKSIGSIQYRLLNPFNNQEIDNRGAPMLISLSYW